jgi:hypothetical protein
MLFADIDTLVHQMKQSSMVIRADQAAKCLRDGTGNISTWGLQLVVLVSLVLIMDLQCPELVDFRDGLIKSLRY